MVFFVWLALGDEKEGHIVKRADRDSACTKGLLSALLVATLLASVLLNFPPLLERPEEARAATGEILLLSSSTSGTLGNNTSDSPAMTPDTRYVVFSTASTNLVEGDANGMRDIFRKDIQTGELARCSLTSAAVEPNQHCYAPAISGDGRYVIFRTTASNLVPDDTNTVDDIFCKDMASGDLTRVSTDSTGAQANGKSDYPCINGDGSYIAFASWATNLVAGGTTGTQIFRKDRVSGEVEIVSESGAGTLGNGNCSSPRISSSGRYIAFGSAATNLVPGDVNARYDVFRKDMDTGAVLLCSCTQSDFQGDYDSSEPSMSTDGRYVTFTTISKLLAADVNDSADTYRKDLTTGLLAACSTSPAGAYVSGITTYSAISDDGRYVAFRANTLQLAGSSSSHTWSVYLKDMQTGRVLHCANSATNTGGTTSGSHAPCISADGRYVAFSSSSDDLVPGDTNARSDIFRKEPLLEAPFITYMSANQGTPGTPVTLRGFDFGAARGSSVVKFGDVACSDYTFWSDTEISTVAPEGITGTEPVTVTTGAGTSNLVSFAVSPPHIDSMEPPWGWIGSYVTILGSSFGTSRGSGYVSFGRTNATEYLQWSDSVITVKVPYSYSMTGQVEVKVINDRGTSNAVWFEVDDYVVSFAEGYTGAGFQEYLCIGNPHPWSAQVSVFLIFPDGSGLQGDFDIPSESRTTIDVNQVVGPGMEVSALVQSNLEIVVERPLYFAYGNGWTGGSDVVGSPWFSTGWCFAEGYTGAGFEEWITVLNPTSYTANLTFHFQTQEAGELDAQGSVPPGSRRSFKANDLLGAGYQCALFLESDQPIVAERSCYFDYLGMGNYHWTGGHCVMGTPFMTKEYFFAEGTTRGNFEEWITLQNIDAFPITVNASYQLGAGQGGVINKSYTIGPEQRYTVLVSNEVGVGKDVSVRLSSDSFFLAERPMYFAYGPGWTGGHCVIGSISTSPDWFFAEGYTGSGFDEYLCLQNPGSQDAVVQLDYLSQDGGSISPKQVTVPANSRTTVWVNDNAGPGRELSVKLHVVSGPDIVAERPMYFSYAGAWDGGHDVVGFAPGLFSAGQASTASSDGPTVPVARTVRAAEALQQMPEFPHW